MLLFWRREASPRRGECELRSCSLTFAFAALIRSTNESRGELVS